MKGMFIKDFLVLKSYARTIAVLLIFYSIFGTATGMTSFITGMIPFLCVFVSISAFSYDDLARWNAYALTLPVSRRQMVTARYLMALALLGAGMVIALAAALITAPLTAQTSPIGETLLNLLGVSAAGLMLISILIPLLYKFGAEKGRLLILLVVLVPMGLGFLASKLDLTLPRLENIERIIAVGLPLAGLALFLASYFVSLGVMNRKEF